MQAMTSTRSPGLHKPKSQIRLRVDLPHSSPKSPQNNTRLTEIALSQTLSSSSTSSLLNASSTSHTSTCTVNGPLDSLGASTNTASTGTSRWSRGDSRNAFALDLSPSSESETDNYRNPAFDTISYATASPQSIAFGARVESDSTVAFQNPYHVTSSRESLTESVTSDDLQYTAKQTRLSEYQHELPQEIVVADDVYCMSDEQLTERFGFYKEIGWGNWGSVWRARPMKYKAQDGEKAIGLKLGLRSAMMSGSEACGFIAVKVVHRKVEPMTKRNRAIIGARVRALWSEMKILRMLRHEPHPSIINFEAFVITPCFALVIMPYLSHLIELCLPPHRATPYMRQIASAVGYLHERGITHNDIKPANIMITYNDVPVLVDFGFATKWESGTKGSFLSTISWGTPEYLDPYRAKGLPHDERASDVWSLGVTMFELLVGRTPFEYEDEGSVKSKEDLLEYYHRSAEGRWLGEWNIPRGLEKLIRAMVCIDPTFRISAMQAYHHPALHPKSPEVIVTPRFVREAAREFEETPPLPLPYSSERDKEDEDLAEKKKKTRKAKKKTHRVPARAATPALGESIKQHTSTPFMHGTEKAGLKRTVTPSPRKGASGRDKQHLAPAMLQPDEEDITPTKRGKPARELRPIELSLGDKMPRVSGAKANTLSRATSANSLATTAAKENVDNRNSAISTASTVPAKTKVEAVLRTMRSLEGTRRIERVKSRDVLAAIKRPAPSPPRPRSLDGQVEADSKKSKEEQRRSLGIERQLAALKEESPIRAQAPGAKASTPKKAMPSSPPRKSPARSVRAPSMTSPPRPRINTRPTEVVRDGRPFPAGEPSSPLTELRHKILTMDKDNLERFRKVSGDLMTKRSSGTLADTLAYEPVQASSTAAPSDARMDKFASWVKDVEKMVQEARKAIEEGREPMLPSVASLASPEGVVVPDVNILPPTEDAPPPASEVVEEDDESREVGKVNPRRFGLTPTKSGAIPAHLRTSSVQVEPATPPKWMTEKEAEELARQALEAESVKEEEGAIEEQKPAQPEGRELKEKKSGSLGKMDLAVMRKGPKKDRPTVSHVLKLFGNEKDKTGVRANTPEPMGTVPLKSPGPVLRGAPSTPALRSATLRQSKQLGRKSESNLRNLNTMPTLAALMAESAEADQNRISPRRAVYEDLLEFEPGVVRQGDGWSSWTSGPSHSKPMGKTTSMASLREKALSFLRDDHRESRDLKHLQSENQLRRENRDSRDLNNLNEASGVRDRHIVDLSKEVQDQSDRLRRGSRSDLKDARRPGTPGASSVLKGQAEKKGILGRLKGLVGRKGMERVDEV